MRTISLIHFLRLLGFCGSLCIPSLYAHEKWLVQANPHHPGFFSYFNAVIGILDQYDNISDGDTSIAIDCGTVGWYYDPSRGPNWWSYYFEQDYVNFNSNTITRIFSDPREFSHLNSVGFLMERRHAHDLICKYIHIKKHILEKVNTFIQQHFNNAYVIGIHYRATDKWSEARIVPHQEAIACLKKIVNQYVKGNVRIFVATDDQHFLKHLQQEFPNIIIATNAQRSQTKEAVHMMRSGNPYQKGEEALIDCLLLSKCDVLVKTSSNLSEASMKFNPSLPVIYLSKPYGM